MTVVSISREPDDLIADVRISIGSPRGFDGLYMVFRGDPDKVIDILQYALIVAKTDLPEGKYDDKRSQS